MNELEELYTDTIYLIKKDGTRLGPGRALVGNNKIATPNADLEIEDGDTIARKIGSREELYLVIDCGYSQGLGDEIPPSYNAKVRKSTAPAPTPRSVTTNFHTQIHGGTGVQVGQHNTMEVTTTLQQNLTQIIEKSAATPEQKTEAKSALTKFLTNEGVKAVFETLASGAAEGVTKGLKG